MAYEKDRKWTTSRHDRNKTGRRVGYFILGIFIGLLLAHQWNKYHNADMFGRRSVSLSLLTGLLSLSGSVSAQKCQTDTLISSPPSNASVALQSYSYCGGTLKVGVCATQPAVLDCLANHVRHSCKISHLTR